MSLANVRQFDGELLASWEVVNGQLVRTMTQPREDLILSDLQEIRKSRDALRPLDGMGWELCIPELHFHRLIKRLPDLQSPDREICLRAWKKFLGSSDSDIYRVRHRRRARVSQA